MFIRVYLDEEPLARLRQVARAEDRNYRAQARVLILEGLDRHPAGQLAPAEQSPLTDERRATVAA